MPANSQSAIPAAFNAVMDKDARRKIIANPKQYARDTGMDVEGKEVTVTVCTKDTVYLPIQQAPESDELSSDELGKVSAAGINMATVGSGGTLSTICSSLSSASTAGTAGTP